MRTYPALNGVFTEAEYHDFCRRVHIAVRENRGVRLSVKETALILQMRYLLDDGHTNGSWITYSPETCLLYTSDAADE